MTRADATARGLCALGTARVGLGLPRPLALLMLLHEAEMADTTVTKVDSRYSPHGAMGQVYLASGVTLGMRLWREEQVGEPDTVTRRDYEVVGYVLEGRAELEIEQQKVLLTKGDSYVVPRGAAHRYRILEPFSAVEATAPPAQAHGRDERSRGSES